MLRIRLSRTGKKRQPSYRVVVAEKESKRDGRVVERIGHYNPLPNPAEYLIEEDRALYWLSVGAQPSDAVRILLKKQGTLDRLTRFHAGESLDALVTEYQGVAPDAVAPQAAAVASVPVVAAPVVLETEAEAPSIVEQVTDTTGDVAEAVAAPAVAVNEEIEEAIEAALATDEEE